jgi:hypothetical protein
VVGIPFNKDFFAALKPVISPTYRYFWKPEKPAIFDFYHNSNR